jgi:hypothetical protein
MVMKTSKTEQEKKGRVKVDKLQADKKAVKDLSNKDAQAGKGGLAGRRRLTGT